MPRSPLTVLRTIPLPRTRRGPDSSRTRRRAAARFGAAGAVPVLAASAVAFTVVSGGGGGAVQAGPEQLPATLTADENSVFTLRGHGHGHGRGMGQWGAYGYAVDHGWDAERILSHYYGGTELTRQDHGPIAVRLMGLDGQDPAVTSDAPMTIGGHEIPAGSAVVLHPTPAGGEVTVTDGCGGAPGETFTTDDPRVSPTAGAMLSVCGGATYRGDLGVALDGGEARTVNHVDMEDYLRGVLPEEISAGWADKGAAEALKAQAVAARSYAAADHRYGYADTCDTQDCQVYGGTAQEDPRTDEAVAQTAGLTLTRGGQPVAAEFSASTGGWTAGGDFPAVEDAGDDASPDHDWVREVSAAEVSDAFDVGPLQEMTVTARNGLGEDGGRVVTLHVAGADGAVDVTGPQARVALGLKSDWFTIDGQDAPASVVPPASSGTLDPGVLAPAVPDGPAPGGDGTDGEDTDIVGGAGITAGDIRRAADALGAVTGAAGGDPDLGDAIGMLGDAAARGLQAYADARGGE